MGPSSLDIQQEGRISSLETHVVRMVPLIEDIHADMTRRRARWSLVTDGLKYGAWLIAGVATLIGVGKTESFAAWMGSMPLHH